MEITIYNPQKGRLETINVAFTDENTTWFDDCENDGDVNMITDFEGCLLISELGYNYPVLIYDILRKEIGHNKSKANELRGLYV